MSSGWKKFWTFLLGRALRDRALSRSWPVWSCAGTCSTRRSTRRRWRTTTSTSACMSMSSAIRRYRDSLADDVGDRKQSAGRRTYAELIAVFNMVLPPPRLQSATRAFPSGITGLPGDTLALNWSRTCLWTRWWTPMRWPSASPTPWSQGAIQVAAKGRAVGRGGCRPVDQGGVGRLSGRGQCRAKSARCRRRWSVCRSAR